MDASAPALKERIKDFVGTYPKVPYGSTETIASSLPSIEYPGGFFFDWRVIFTEYIPVDHAISNMTPRIDDLPPIVKSWDVEVGEKYQLVVTMLHTDLIRNVTSDILECVSMEDKVLKVKSPIFQFHSRSDKLLVLHNFTRMNEQELVKVLEEAKIPFVDFTARKELDNTKEYMRMYIEFKEEVDLEEVTERVHQKLLETDKDYRDLTNMMKFFPLRITELPRNSFKHYLENKEGMFRIARIEMREERLKQLLGES